MLWFSDLLAVPKHPYAAMENWGLSVFVEQKILLDAEVSSSSYQMELTMVVVHEICHQVRNFGWCETPDETAAQSQQGAADERQREKAAVLTRSPVGRLQAAAGKRRANVDAAVFYVI